MYEGFDILDQLTAAIRTRLRDDAGFGGPPAVEILTERLSNLENRINQALQSKLGLCLIVSTPEITTGDHPMNLIASISVLVNENVAQNQYDGGTRITASAAALRAYLMLQRWAPPNWSPLVAIDGTAPMRLVGGQVGDSPIITYEVALQTQTVIDMQITDATPLSGTP